MHDVYIHNIWEGRKLFQPCRYIYNKFKHKIYLKSKTKLKKKIGQRKLWQPINNIHIKMFWKTNNKAEKMCKTFDKLLKYFVGRCWMWNPVWGTNLIGRKNKQSCSHFAKSGGRVEISWTRVSWQKVFLFTFSYHIFITSYYLVILKNPYS